MTDRSIEISSKVASKNDAFRHQMTGCVVTKGVAALYPILNDVFVRVRDFKDFDAENDPYGEHDFGSFEYLGTRFIWKMDYYQQDTAVWCDPLDENCRREITLMLASEY